MLLSTYCMQFKVTIIIYQIFSPITLLMWLILFKWITSSRNGWIFLCLYLQRTPFLTSPPLSFCLHLYFMRDLVYLFIFFFFVSRWHFFLLLALLSASFLPFAKYVLGSVWSTLDACIFCNNLLSFNLCSYWSLSSIFLSLVGWVGRARKGFPVREVLWKFIWTLGKMRLHS